MLFSGFAGSIPDLSSPREILKESLAAPPAEWENRKRHFSFCSFCQFANFTISFCQQNEQNGKFEICFHSTHSAHSASLLTLPFHSASRMSQFANFTISFCQQNEQNGQNGKFEKIYFSFCSFCQFANFTISYCQQNGQNGKFEKYTFHPASLLTLSFYSASRMGRMGISTKAFFILLILPVC